MSIVMIVLIIILVIIMMVVYGFVEQVTAPLIPHVPKRSYVRDTPE